MLSLDVWKRCCGIDWSVYNDSLVRRNGVIEDGHATLYGTSNYWMRGMVAYTHNGYRVAPPLSASPDSGSH